MSYDDLEKIIQSLTSSNYDLIMINIFVSCLAVIGVYIHSRLKKSAELSEINRNFSNVLSQQKKLTEQTEKIKQTINKDSIDFQIRHNAYNQKCIESINSIYIKLIELRNIAKKLGFEPTKEQSNSLFNAVEEFRYEHDVKKIWLPITLSVQIEEIAIQLDNQCHKFIIANSRMENILAMPDDIFAKHCKAQDDFYEFINKQIEPIFNTLVKQISYVVDANKT